MGIMTLYFRSAGLSDIGLGRRRNEDAWVKLDSCGFYALADGMGGHPAGDIAATQSLHHLCRLARMHLPLFFAGDPKVEELGELIKSFTCQTNDYLYKLGLADPELKGMGSTLLSLCLIGDKAVFSHVGDSRIYRWREGVLEQLTQDHSLLRELKSSGILPDQKIQKRVRSVLTRAMGTRSSVKPEIGFAEAKGGDLFLLCSDGLSNVVSHRLMNEIIAESASIEEATERLVNTARALKGRDNITTLLLQLEEVDETHLSRQQRNNRNRPTSTRSALRGTF